MKELLVALLIVAAVTVVSYADTPTGFATYKFDKLTVSNMHPLIATPTYSPNGDGIADIVTASVSGKCSLYHKAVVGVFSVTGTCEAGAISLITSTMSTNCAVAGSASCQFSGLLSWNGKYSSGGNAADGKYCIISGCTGQNDDADKTTRDKVITININKTLYPASINYNGAACGTKPKCSLQKDWTGWGTGCKKTTTQNVIAQCNNANGNADSCVASDTGSCKKNYGWAGNVESCSEVSGIGICSAKGALPGK